MKIHCKYTGIKGFLTVYDHAVRYRYMITETAKKENESISSTGKSMVWNQQRTLLSVTKNLV